MVVVGRLRAYLPTLTFLLALTNSPRLCHGMPLLLFSPNQRLIPSRFIPSRLHSASIPKPPDHQYSVSHPGLLVVVLIESSPLQLQGLDPNTLYAKNGLGINTSFTLPIYLPLYTPIHACCPSS